MYTQTLFVTSDVQDFNIQLHNKPEIIDFIELAAYRIALNNPSAQPFFQVGFSHLNVAHFAQGASPDLVQLPFSEDPNSVNTLAFPASMKIQLRKEDAASQIRCSLYDATGLQGGIANFNNICLWFVLHCRPYAPIVTTADTLEFDIGG